MTKTNYSLYLVTDSSICLKQNLLAATEEAIQNGVNIVQLREKNLNSLDFFRLAVKMRDLTCKYNVPLIINDRLDIALATEADGVHLGQTDLPAKYVRKLTIPEFIIGVSAKTIPQALEAQEAGANYLGVGAIFPTTTKVITQNTPVTTLNAIISKVKIPVIAIGGLNIGNIDALLNSKIAGIAVVSAILASDNIGATVQDLKTKIKQIKNNNSPC